MRTRVTILTTAVLAVSLGVGVQRLGADGGERHVRQRPWETYGTGALNTDGLPASLPAIDCTGKVVATIENPLDPNRVEGWTAPRVAGAPCAGARQTIDGLLPGQGAPDSNP